MRAAAPRTVACVATQSVSPSSSSFRRSLTCQYCTPRSPSLADTSRGTRGSPPPMSGRKKTERDASRAIRREFLFEKRLKLPSSRPQLPMADEGGPAKRARTGGADADAFHSSLSRALVALDGGNLLAAMAIVQGAVRAVNEPAAGGGVEEMNEVRCGGGPPARERPLRGRTSPLRSHPHPVRRVSVCTSHRGAAHLRVRAPSCGPPPLSVRRHLWHSRPPPTRLSSVIHH